MAKTIENDLLQKGCQKQHLRISIEQYNREIDEAIARVEAGDYYTHAEVEQMAKDW